MSDIERTEFNLPDGVDAAREAVVHLEGASARLELARAQVELGALLRLIGYLARPSTQRMLLEYADPDEPRDLYGMLLRCEAAMTAADTQRQPALS